MAAVKRDQKQRTENDALMDTFYEIAGEEYRSCGDYAVYMFHDRYDIPVKAADHERVGESEEVYEYLICIFAPVSGDYEPGQPECGFIYPAFCDRSSDWNYVDIYQKNPERPHNELRKILGV